jgi:putative phage-type endonuclease
MDDKILQERKKGIGGSDAAAICGLSKWRTPLQVWEDKRGLSGPIPDNEPMLWGRKLEPVVRQRYSDITGRVVRLPDDILKHPTHEYMLANIDGFTDDNRGVEVKTAAYPSGWGEPGTDDIPIGYIFQVQHYMMITAFPVFDIPVLIGGNDFRIYEVPEDKELQELLMEKEGEFWRLVQNNIPPAPVSYEDVQRLYRHSQAKTITATGEIEGLLKELKNVRASRKDFDEREEVIQKTIMEFMKESDTLLDLAGKPIATWKSGKPAKRIDLKALQAEQAEIYSKYLKAGESQRRFLIK